MSNVPNCNIRKEATLTVRRSLVMQKIGAEASDRWRHRLEVPAPVRRSDVIDLTAVLLGSMVTFLLV